MLVADKNHCEHVGTSLQMMKFLDFGVMEQVDHASVLHNAEKTTNLFKYIQICIFEILRIRI